MKTKLLWIQGLACNGNSHSFLNYPDMDRFLKDFEFIHHPIFDSAYSLEMVVNEYIDCDILLIEGTISDDFTRGGKKVVDIINLYAPKVKHIITLGTCATFGGIFQESPYQNSSGFLYKKEDVVERLLDYKNKVISISGCPIHPQIFVDTLYLLKEGFEIIVDEFHRPKEFYAYSVHNGCVRNEYFEYKIDKHNFGEREGCMFYDHGCQAPFTHGSCNKILWNEVNSKTRAGQPCMGCTEPDFPKDNLYETKKNMGIPQYLPFGIPKRAYLTLSGVTKAFKIERFSKRLFDE
jgi:hydrogenase small subunit